MAKTGLPTFNTYIYNSYAGETCPLSVTSTSSSVTFSLTASAKNTDVIITNAGSYIAFVAFGLASKGVTATVPGTNGTINAFPVLPGAIYTMQKQSDNQQADTCASIYNSRQTTTLYFTSVQGS